VAFREHPGRLKADPELEIELGVCHHYRIPHSEFLSWSDDDRAKAIWTYIRERTTCSQCGTRAEEWDPAKGGHRRAYIATVETCRGCQAMKTRENGLTDQQRAGGNHVVLRKNPEVKRGESA
jgi:hypothetical protein